MGNQVKNFDTLPSPRSLRSKYYKTFRQRISAKTGHLLKPDHNQKLIARLKEELNLLAFKFRAVFDSSNSYFIILEKELDIVDCNKASLKLVKKLFGKKIAIGEKITNFLHPSSAKIVTDLCDRTIGGESFAVERKIGYLDNKITWWSFEFSPAMDLRGNITGLVFNATDITKRKAYEAKILTQRKKLMDISAIQSHEIRGPVCTIMGIMSLIKESGYETDRKYLMLLETTTNLLDKNIRDIVDIAGGD